MARPIASVWSALLLACVLAGHAAAQREAGGVPPSRDARLAGRLTRSVPSRRAGAVDVAWLRAEDARAPKGAPLRYGVLVPLELGSDDAGLWEDLPDGSRIWRARITSPGARSLGLVFRRFQLPPGGELWVHGASGDVVHGAYTDANHRPQGGFAIQPIPGDALTLEYRAPAGASAPELSLAGVVHDYLGVLELALKSGEAGKAASCELDVACPAGLGREEQADSVARILAGGFLCSGVLLDNTAGDGAQLLLSAEHCGDLEDAVFFFRYQRPLCGAGSAPATYTVQGSAELVRDSALDVQLVRITEPVPEAWHAFLAGWDRTGLIPPSTLTVHHPQGQPKKISFDDDPPLRSGKRWRIAEWDLGVTEPGSSGAPLFSAEGLVIGQLCCGSATCGYPFDDYFGRMDAEWSLLAPHLDPLASGASSAPGRPLAGSPAAQLAIERVEPEVVPALQPGTRQTLTLHGTAFAPDAGVLVDGVALASRSFTVLSSDTLTLDLPQVVFLGSHSLAVASQGRLAFATVLVVAPSAPLLQVGSGEEAPGNRVSASAGLDLVLGGPVGQTQYVLYSTSSVPSVLPSVTLCMGQGFTVLELATAGVVGAPGWTGVHLPLPPLDLTLFLQSVTFENGLPIPVSNCQSVAIVP